jgi:hypothetical protein
VKALLIPVDGPPGEVDLPGGGTRFMRSLKALIGTDCAERIQVTSRWEAWLDEDGAAAGKPANQAATLIAQSFGFEFSLLGPVVIVGVDKDTAEPAALSPAQAGAILAGRGHPREDRRAIPVIPLRGLRSMALTLISRLEFGSGLVAMRYEPRRFTALPPTAARDPVCRPFACAEDHGGAFLSLCDQFGRPR